MTASGLEENSVLFGAGFWYQTNPVPDKWSRFLAPVFGRIYYEY